MGGVAFSPPSEWCSFLPSLLGWLPSSLWVVVLSSLVPFGRCYFSPSLSPSLSFGAVVPSSPLLRLQGGAASSSLHKQYTSRISSYYGHKHKRRRGAVPSQRRKEKATPPTSGKQRNPEGDRRATVPPKRTRWENVTGLNFWSSLTQFLLVTLFNESS